MISIENFYLVHDIKQQILFPQFFSWFFRSFSCWKTKQTFYWSKIFWILSSFSNHILLGKANFIEVMIDLQTLCGYYVCIYVTTYWAARYLMHFKVCKDSWDSHIYNLATVETKSLPKKWVFSTNYIFEIIDLFYFILLIHTGQTKFFLILKVSSSYHLCVKCFSQLSFDSEV